jgi:phospholipid/cholesterol/gamma-HCH transport system permease protein
MSHAKSEAAQEWKHAAVSTASMYGNFFFWLFREPFPTRQLGQQIVRVMLEGFGILAVAGVVEGAMFAWLAGWYGTKFSVINWAGAASLYLLLTAATTLFGAMMFAAKIGTAFTVEIGSMQMSGQLDALRLMAVEPTQYITIPRVLASILSFPILKAISDACSILAAILLARLWFDISVPVFLQHALLVLRPTILTTSYIRCALHGFFISINACGLGFYFQGGAIELGRTTTKSIVINLVCVLVIDTVYGVMDSVFGWSTM